MIVSMLQVVFELPEITSLKDKRRVVMAIKQRTKRKFSVSCAEVDLMDSLRFSQIGVALVSNSKEFGEKVMNSVLLFIEDGFDLRIHDSQIHSESFE